MRSDLGMDLLAHLARQLFASDLGVQGAMCLRGCGTALAIALIQLLYYQRTNPVLPNGARHALEEILEDTRLSW